VEPQPPPVPEALEPLLELRVQQPVQQGGAGLPRQEQQEQQERPAAVQPAQPASVRREQQEQAQPLQERRGPLVVEQVLVPQQAQVPPERELVRLRGLLGH